MGFINDGQGYEWVFVSIVHVGARPLLFADPVLQYWCAIFCGILILIIFFFMEETKFNRSKYLASDYIDGRPQTSFSQTPSGLENQGNTVDKKDENLDRDPMTTTTSHISVPEGVASYVKKPRLARLKPIEPENLHGKNRLLKLISRPILLLAFPIISYAGFIYGCNIVWLSVANATESMVLSNNPYNMSTSQVGLTFIAPLIGTTLA